MSAQGICAWFSGSRTDQKDLDPRQKFRKDIKDMDEQRLVNYIKQNPDALNFLGDGEALKIKKRSKDSMFSRLMRRDKSADVNDGIQSKRLKKSVIILRNGDKITMFRTEKNEIKESEGIHNSHVEHWREHSRPKGEVLGDGLTKTVWKVHDLITNEYVAIGQAFNCQKWVTDMKKEAVLTKIIPSSYILPVQHCTRVKASGEIIGYTITPVCQGSLKKILENNPRYLIEHPEIILHIKKGVEDSYAAGIKHNDLHSGNVFITADGQAVLADFGEAGIAKKEIVPSYPKEGGGIHYMSELSVIRGFAISCNFYEEYLKDCETHGNKPDPEIMCAVEELQLDNMDLCYSLDPRISMDESIGSIELALEQRHFGIQREL